jgi:choline dehydrogenase-like flavoprotein
MNTALARKERHLRWLLVALSVGFAVSILIYLVGGFIGDENFPFVANSTAKDGLFLALSLLALADMRRFGWLAWLVMLGHAILAVTLITLVLTGNVNMAPSHIGPVTVDAWIPALAWGLVDVAIVIGLYRLLTAVGRLRGHLWYLSPLQFEIVKGLSEVLIPDKHRRVTPERIAHNVDIYLAKFNAKGKSKVKGGLIALAPFAALSPDTGRRWLKKMTKGEGWFSRRLGKLLQPVIGVGAQVVYLGYYGDPATFESIGYKRFADRPDYPGIAAIEQLARRHVKCMDPEGTSDGELEADHVIVGSGAAGAILAYELAARGREVLVLERGKHVDPSEFNDVETNMLSELYSDGAIQISRDLRFAVLQGMCVGGSTVVNNAVCIKAPDDVLERWTDPNGLNAGIDLHRLEAAYSHLAGWLPITLQPPSVVAGGARKFLAGVDELRLNDRVEVVKANIVDCYGCGYCNIGCKYGKKLSMLETVLPRAQDEFGDKVRVLPECFAKRIEMDGPRARSVLCELGRNGRTVRVRARESVIVSAGAVHSSLLLRRSRIRLSVAGKGLAFNMATPLTAHFKGETLNSYDGLQISHYLRPPEDAGYVIETWFNPPAMQSLFMPGWSKDHYRNMKHYGQMACAGVVVGTQSNGSVRRGLLGDFEFKPEREDVRSLMRGVKQLAEIFLEAGATKVMPSTYRYRSFKRGEDLDPLYDYAENRTGISLYSAHPQGGNAISVTADKGVVDSSFKVHGLENVYVCDASVFPSSITVNPQYTVMALAHYAGFEMTGVESHPPGPSRVPTQRFVPEPVADHRRTGIPD